MCAHVRASLQHPAPTDTGAHVSVCFYCVFVYLGDVTIYCMSPPWLPRGKRGRPTRPMSSDSESGFSFPAPKPRSSSERARQDAIARGRTRSPAGSGDLFGSISDLGLGGQPADLGLSLDPVPTSEEPKLVLDGIPSGFFETADEHESQDPFSVPAGLDDRAAQHSEATAELETEPFLSTARPVSDPSDDRLQLVGIPSGFFTAAGDERGLDLPDDGPEAPADYRVDAEEDLNDSQFDFDIDLPSVLGEQPQRESAVVPEKAEQEPSDGHLTIPPNAAAIARPAADTGFAQRTLQSAPTRAQSRPSRVSGSHASPARAALRARQPLLDESPGVMVIPAMPVKAAYSAALVPSMLSGQDPVSPTRNRGVPSGSHRQIGKSPRPVVAAKTQTTEPNTDGLPLAALRRKTSGSYSAVAEELVLRAFESNLPDSPEFRVDPAAPAGRGDDVSLRSEDSTGCETALDFDEFDYGGVSSSGPIKAAIERTTALGLQTIGDAEVDGDLTQPPSAASAAQQLRAQSAPIGRAVQYTSSSGSVEAASTTAIPSLLERADSTAGGPPISTPLPPRVVQASPMSDGDAGQGTSLEMNPIPVTGQGGSIELDLAKIPPASSWEDDEFVPALEPQAPGSRETASRGEHLELPQLLGAPNTKSGKPVTDAKPVTKNGSDSFESDSVARGWL